MGKGHFHQATNKGRSEHFLQKLSIRELFFRSCHKGKQSCQLRTKCTRGKPLKLESWLGKGPKTKKQN